MEKLDFRTKLIEVRKERGLTQEEVAEKCRITVRTIQRIESGLVEPRTFTIKIISDALGFNYFETSNTGNEVNEIKQISDFEKRTILWFVKDLFNLKTNTMKKVSILTSFFLVVGLTLIILPSKINAQSGNKEQFNSVTIKYDENKIIKRIEVVFTNVLTLDSLVRIKNDLQTKNISINYKKIDFDKNNFLKSIDCEVDCNDGFSGSFEIDLGTLDKNEKFGFYRDYSKNAKSTFGTGGIRN